MNIKIGLRTPAQTQHPVDIHEAKREAYYQNGMDTWRAYQANRLHVTGKEADAWLYKLEIGQDVEPPECHV